MGKRTLELSDELYDYLLEVSSREPEVLARLREETDEMPDGMMQISPDQGQFMALLIELMGATQILEIGTFTGYSALAMALVLPPEGRIVACDVDADTAAVARRYWAEAGVADKIDLRLAPALETLDGLLAEGRAGSFDFAFIDADKENYDAYYERSLDLLRPGGLIAVDNVLWGGSVANPERQNASTLAIRALNEKIGGDQRVSASLLPIGDGVNLARKR